MQAQHNPYTMYKYYGAPAVAFREGGLAEYYLGAGETSQASAASAAQATRAPTGALTAYDLVAALTAFDPQRHAQVAAAKAPDGMAPAAAATIMHHAEMNAHFGHPLPRNAPRKFVEKIPKVVQPTTCEVCKIQLTALHDLRTHETGKKHKKNLEKLQDSITPRQENPSNGAVGASTTPAAAVADCVMPAVQPKKNKSSAATPEDLEVKKRRVLEAGAAQDGLKICTMSNVVKKIPKVVQSVTCEVCKIQCTTLDNLWTHETGKKHKKNLEKLQDSITSEPAKPPNGAVGASTAPAAPVADGVIPAVQPKKNKSSAATPEDLEAKKRRLIEAGAAEGELKLCTMCNVVVMNQKGYKHHIAGNKHKAKVQPPNGAVGVSTAAAAAAVADAVMPAVQPKKNKSSAATPEDRSEEEATD